MLVCFRLHAQSDSSKISVVANAHFGFIIPEYKNISYIVDDFVKGFEVNIEKRANGGQDFEQSFNRPSFGLSVFYSTLGNQKIHGDEFGIYPYFKIPLLDGKKLSITQAIGIGLSYATRRFDIISNPYNVAIGSHLNIHFNFRIGFQYRINPKVTANLGFSFSHLSNANLAEPNLGLNSATTYFGLNYCLGKDQFVPKRILAPHVKKNEFGFAYNFGGKHTRSLQSKVYVTSSISMDVRRKINRKVELGLGIDGFYDSSAKTEFEDQKKSNFRSSYFFKTGIHFSQTIVYNRASVCLQEGIYLGLTDKISKFKIYNRLLFKYRITRFLFVTLAMKSHIQVLDSPELGFGYSFTQIKKK